MTTVTINDDLAARLRVLRDAGDDFNRVVETALDETVRRWEREAAARAEAQAILNGPRRPFAEAEADFRRRHHLPNPSGLTHEELIEQAEAALAALPPERIAEAERLGLI